MQRPRVPIWVGGELPAEGPLVRTARRVTGTPPARATGPRAARWDGFVPISPGRPGARATAAQIAAARERIGDLRGSAADFDIAVWGELDSAGQVAAHLREYHAAGATWWLESPGAGPGWLDSVRDRLRRGPEVKSPRG